MQTFTSSNQATDNPILARYEQGGTSTQALLAPLWEIAEESSTMIPGFAFGRERVRENAIPFFHLLGEALPGGVEPVRVLLVGGVAGYENFAGTVVASLIAKIEPVSRFRAGLEITALPFVHGTDSLTLQPLWHGIADNAHSALEREALRQKFDLVIHVKEAPHNVDLHVEGWSANSGATRVLKDAHRRIESESQLLWSAFNREASVLPRIFTPFPNETDSPAELAVEIPTGIPAVTVLDTFLTHFLFVTHSLRQARQEGIL